MKRFVIASAALVALALFGAVATAQGPGDWYRGGGWGPGMMGGYRGQYDHPCGGPGMMGYGPGWTAPQTQINEDSAKQLAQQYTDRYLKGFTVEKVLPFTGMGGMTMYQAELKGPKDEVRTLHINPWGNVMPFGAAQTRTR